MMTLSRQGGVLLVSKGRLFDPSWFPSIHTAPTDSAIPSSQCFLLQSLHRCLCILHCYGSHCFSVLQAFTYSLPCLDEVLQFSVHPNHRHPSTPTNFYSPNIRFSTSILSDRFATSPYLVVAYPLWGFTASFVNNTGLGYSVGGWRICGGK